MAEPEKRKTSMGLDENVAGLLSYLAWFITGLVFYFGEKENQSVRFHALQSIALTITVVAASIALWIVNLILGAMGAHFLVTLLSFLFWIGVLVLWIFLMFKAYRGERFKLPVLGDICEKQLR
jgi:uncharacterized membrane protein